MKPAKVYDRNISFNRAFVDFGIGITGALMLSQAVYWSRKTEDPEGWFYKSGKEWEEETGLTRSEQETARRRLLDLNLIEEERRGLPCTMHYRVKVANLEAMLNGGQGSLFPEKQLDSLLPSRKPHRAKAANPRAEIPRTYTKTTSELPTGTTSDKRRGTRLPDDWALPDDWRKVAIDLGVPAGAIDTEAAKFKDHWTAKSRDNTKLDWQATWRTWCRNSVEWTYKNNPKGGTINDQRAATVATLTGRNRQQGDFIDSTAEHVD